MTDPARPALALREATREDAAALARLHAASWRATYRGVLSDAWLATALDDDRLALWRARLASPPPGQHVLVAVAPGADAWPAADAVLAGFACTYLDDHPVHGTLLENLHVAAAWKGRGLGARLMRAAARHAAARAPASGFHLSVVRANAAARGFYEHQGARWLAAEDWHAPDGGVIACDVLGWARAIDLG